MAVTGKPYNLKTCPLFVGGVSISGFGEDGGVVHTWASDLVEVTTGADGESVGSRLNNDDMLVTITLMTSSLGYKRLANLMNAQRLLYDAGATLVNLPYLFADPHNGDGVAAGSFFFLNRPEMAKNKKIAEVEFRLHLVKPKVSFGLAITT
jgi:hypothetical protein